MKPEEVERSFARGQRILERGATTRALYIVRSGGVRIDAEDGRPARRLAGGAIFGEISGILGEGSPYRATAEEDSVVLVLDVPLMNRMCRESPEFSMRLIRHLALEWARVAEEPVTVMEVPDELLSLVGAILKRREGESECPAVSGTLRDLAHDAGLPMETAYRNLHDLLDRGWLSLSDDQLNVAAVDALEALVR